MIFVDTNYFLRFLLNDETEQHLIAKKLFIEASEGKVQLTTSLIVFFEIYWVLSSYYEKDKLETTQMLQKILSLNFIDLRERQTLFNSLSLFQKINLDLEDCYNFYYAKSMNIKPEGFKTFDKKLLREYTK
jgi:predicted nucleic-acid-binding protein